MNNDRTCRITAETIRSLGITFDNSEDESRFYDFVTEELETNVGAAISEIFSEEQLSEFDRIAAPDDARAWLERNCPDYRWTVNAEVRSMKLRLMRLGKEISTGVVDHQNIRPTSIDDLELSIRSRNALKRYGIEAVGELIDIPLEERRHIRYLSRGCWDEIEEKLYVKCNYKLVC